MRSDEGFTLVETLVALAILAGVCASVALSFQLYGARAVEEQRSIRAALLARKVLADFRAEGVDAEASKEGTSPQGGRWTLKTAPLGPGRGLGGIRITVTVTVGQGRSRVQETVSAIRLIYRPRR